MLVSVRRCGKKYLTNILSLVNCPAKKSFICKKDYKLKLNAQQTTQPKMTNYSKSLTNNLKQDYNFIIEHCLGKFFAHLLRRHIRLPIH